MSSKSHSTNGVMWFQSQGQILDSPSLKGKGSELISDPLLFIAEKARVWDDFLSISA